ncbi:probable ATP-dependent RNA helicase spindle-E [Contarinia nasturtii]|uniref:probable ATP-dependent RNA helicase spindle-E n=1 Tax=Contarinia nasturtii TaxID=265458 RepID=UPI0012D44989|nr:probable ATP-dependent RNA helicase spindle-E [Contarinia nasturtii]
MNELDAFMMGKPVQRKMLSGGSTNGRIVTEYETAKYEEDEVVKRTMDYAKPFVKKIRDEVWNRFNRTQIEIDRPETSDIYGRYNFSRRMPMEKLPIEEYRQQILDTIKKNTVVVLRGPTGCGKTTKVPQYILDDYREQGLHCNIIIAQPRRIAASSNAKRVCRERGWPCGSIVGYQVGSDQRQNRSDDTRILFCTTGVLVEKIIHGSNHNPLDQFTHIILDEVHERDKDMDFLMISIYKYLNPKIRIILMSATIDVDKFAKYYQVPSNNWSYGKAPVIELSSERNFTVTSIFLDEIEKLEFDERINSPEISEQMYKCALRLIVFFERIDRLHSEAEGVDAETYEKNPKPTVLIFLPGIFEIKQMYQYLEDWSMINGETRLLRIVMHSTGDPLLTDLAMRQSDKNTRKIILATNIAESSITVPDVKYIIDFCLTRNLVVNKVTSFPSLQLAWASRDNCEQRAGRTGRVRNGWCFRLVSKRFYEREMRQSAKAELVTSPLENIILKTKQLNLGSPEEVLALALDKPYLDEIHNAVLRLKEMGAMLTTVNGKPAIRDGDITYIGEIMSRLPIDVKLSKMIALGYCFGVLEECTIIAAALNCSKNMFTYNRTMGVDAYTKRLEFADGSGSDLFALLNAYKTWKKLRNAGEFGNIKNPKYRNEVKAAEKKWTEANYLEWNSLRECDEYVKDLRVRINRMNLIDCKCDLKWSRNEKYIVLKVVFAGAFYPNYFSRSTKAKRGQTFEAEHFKTLGGRDLSDTVYFTGFKFSDMPHIYIKRIKDILVQNCVISEKDSHNITVSHDGVSERVFVSFKKSGKEGDIRKYGVACNPGFVLTEVYKAIKLRSLKLEQPIDVLSDRNEAIDYARKHGLTYTSDGRVYIKDDTEYENVCYPKKLDKYVKGYISHTENCGRFWFQPSKYLIEINKIFEEINNPNSDLEPFHQESDVVIGQVLAAAFPSDNSKVEFYRAKIINIERDKKTKQITYEVRFIDFGNKITCNLSKLRRLRGVSSHFLSLPPYCYQCSLAYIQPSQLNAPDGVWQQEANLLFVEQTDGIEVEAEIFSIVNGIVRVFLRANGVDINKYLLDNNVAEHCEESYMSKFDHTERDIGRNDKKGRNYLTQGIVRYLQEEDVPTIKPPTRSDGHMHTIKIKGPYTPLDSVLYGLTDSASASPNIDDQSVNHVLLENEPNDMSEKYLVAVSTHQHNENATITIRYTTLMPNIRLFGPLMAAIFAPKIKLLRNTSKTKYIKMITGLGCDANGKCLSSQSNIKFDLDVELTNSDIETINNIRGSMDRLLQRKCFETYDTEKVSGIMKRLQNELISLLSKTRLLLGEEYGDLTWNPYKEDEIDKSLKTSRDECNRILPRHQAMKLYKPESDYLLNMKKHNEDLIKKKDAVNDNPTNRSERCLICNVDIETAIRYHLLSRQHKDGVQWIENAIQDKLRKNSFSI